MASWFLVYVPVFVKHILQELFENGRIGREFETAYSKCLCSASHVIDSLAISLAIISLQNSEGISLFFSGVPRNFSFEKPDAILMLILCILTFPGTFWLMWNFTVMHSGLLSIMEKGLGLGHRTIVLFRNWKLLSPTPPPCASPHSPLLWPPSVGCIYESASTFCLFVCFVF